MKITAIFLLSFALIASLVDAAAEKRFAFDKDPTKFLRGKEYTFKMLDKNNDGFINKADLEVFFKLDKHHWWSFLFGEKHRRRAMEFFSKMLKQMDTDNDGKVSKEEFESGVGGLDKKEITVDADTCKDVKKARNTCKKEFKSAKMRAEIKLLDTMCSKTLSAMSGYQLEQCVLQAKNDCVKMVDCYNIDKETRKNTAELVKREFGARPGAPPGVQPPPSTPGAPQGEFGARPGAPPGVYPPPGTPGAPVQYYGDADGSNVFSIKGFGGLFWMACLVVGTIALLGSAGLLLPFYILMVLVLFASVSASSSY